MLAEVELPRENAIYQAHLTSAELLTRVLRDRNWQEILDDLWRPQGQHPVGRPAGRRHHHGAPTGGWPRRARDFARGSAQEGGPGGTRADDGEDQDSA